MGWIMYFDYTTEWPCCSVGQTVVALAMFARLLGSLNMVVLCLCDVSF